jgi:hypothetical protein
VTHEGLKVCIFLLFLLVPLNHLPHELSQTDRSVVSTGKHQPIKEVLHVEQIASCELCRSAWSFRDLVRNPIVAILEVDLVLLANENGQITSHYLT